SILVIPRPLPRGDVDGPAPALARAEAGRGAVRRGRPGPRHRDPSPHGRPSRDGYGVTDAKELGALAGSASDDRRAALIKRSLSLHGEPEIGYQERKSAAKLTEFIEANGF